MLDTCIVAQIIDHINSAVEIGRHKNPDPGVPQVVDCILKKMPCCMTWFGAHLPIFTALGSVEYDASGKNISKVGGVRWGSNNYHHDHPLFAEYISNRLVTSVGSDEREHLVKKWEDAMIHDLDPMRRHATNTSFGDGEMYENLQLEFNMWVCILQHTLLINASVEIGIKRRLKLVCFGLTDECITHWMVCCWLQKSTRDIIADASKSPLWQIILGAALVSAYAFLAFLNLRNPVHSHTSLALMVRP